MGRGIRLAPFAVSALWIAFAPRIALPAEPPSPAVFLASASFEEASGFDQDEYFDAEGLFPYGFTSKLGPPDSSFSGTIEVRGGGLPLVRVTGDFGPAVGGEATAYAHLDYAVRVDKSDPGAPDVPVPIRISAHAEGLLVRSYGATYPPSWSAFLGYDGVETLMVLPIPVADPNKDSYSDAITFDGTRSLLPGVERRFYLTAIGETYGSGAGTFDVSLDPWVRIDPAFMVEVNGTQRPGSEVYSLALSEGIGSGAPEPGALAASVVAIASLALACRRARSGRRRGRLVSAASVAAGLAIGAAGAPAHAAMVGFEFTAAIDATAFGLASDEPVTLRFAYDPLREPVLMSLGDPPYSVVYGLAHGTLAIGSDLLEIEAGVGVIDANGLYDSFYFSTLDGQFGASITGTIGRSPIGIVAFEILNLSTFEMLTSTALPETAAFAALADTVTLLIRDTDSSREAIAGFQLPRDAGAFEFGVPEPAALPAALAAVVALGSLPRTRHRRRIARVRLERRASRFALPAPREDHPGRGCSSVEST